MGLIVGSGADDGPLLAECCPPRQCSPALVASSLIAALAPDEPNLALCAIWRAAGGER